MSALDCGALLIREEFRGEESSMDVKRLPQRGLRAYVLDDRRYLEHTDIKVV